MKMNSTPKPYIIQYQSIDLSTNRQCILTRFDFCVRKGNKWLISGKSGPGKTTFFRLRLGLENRSEAGRRFKGCPLPRPTFLSSADRFFYLSQDIDFKNRPAAIIFKEVVQASHTRFPVGSIPIAAIKYRIAIILSIFSTEYFPTVIHIVLPENRFQQSGLT